MGDPSPSPPARALPRPLRERVTLAMIASPRPLALLRVVVPLVILVSPELYAARALAAMPERLGFLPEGLGLIARLPIGPATARILLFVALSSATTALLGFWSRTSMAVLTLSAGLLFSLSQRQGAVLHDMHLFWMTTLLAASPCGDAWSLDAWGASPRGSSVRYGVPLFFSRLLLGLVYFFPGVHKLRVSGLSWVTAENITNHMHAKWLENGAVPGLRIDRMPLLCALGAALVLLFELTFVVLALVSARTRFIALGAGLVFHLSTQALLFIPFVSLWACYVVLIDLDAKGAMDTQPGKSTKASGVVGGVLAIVVLVQGFRAQTDAWPFACYPTFSYVQSARIPDVLIEVELTSGVTLRLTGRERRVRSQSDWGRVFRISGAYGDAPSVVALREHGRSTLLAAGIAPSEIVKTRLYRVDVETAPESWRDPPAAGTLLIEVSGAP